MLSYLLKVAVSVHRLVRLQRSMHDPIGRLSEGISHTFWRHRRASIVLGIVCRDMEAISIRGVIVDTAEVMDLRLVV